MLWLGGYNHFVHRTIDVVESGKIVCCMCVPCSKVEYVWEGELESKEYLRRWVLDAKKSTRIEDLQPSKSFTDCF